METKTGFTKGEWKVGTVIQLIPNANLGFAVVAPIDGVEQPIAVVAYRPNAHLIAAAPDLYEALDGVLGYAESLAANFEREGGKTEQWYKKAIEQANKALAKVRGK